MILLLIPAVMLAWAIFAGPVEWACRHDPEFAAWLDRLIERVL